MTEIIPYLTRLTGWLAAGFLVLNFLTCWVMPWSRECQQLACKQEGVEEQAHPLCFYHRPLAWLAIIFALVHIVLAVFT